MAKKPASLEIALGGQSQPVATGTAEVVQHPSAAATRPGKPQEAKLTVYVPPAASKRLRLMCIEHDRDLNSYLREGLDMVLAKYGQPSLAEFSEK